VPRRHLHSFFRQHRKDFAPAAVYRAKTWGRFDRHYQLSFVDLGLMTLVESEMGSGLGELVERTVVELKSELGWDQPTDPQWRWLVKAVFWLLSAKILRDKNVPAFRDLDLVDVDRAYSVVEQHYHTGAPVPVQSPGHRNALATVARQFEQFTDLANLTTESLSYVYESSLISKETRAKLGTHSTPGYLVDYVVGKLRPWIEEIPVAKRHVFEPACGHAAFLVSAMRLLRELIPDRSRFADRRHSYLRDHLHGIDIDPFALEIARLSLTLADVPNPNGWDLQNDNMFHGGQLEDSAKRAAILLSNPPFENFSRSDKRSLSEENVELVHHNKAAEVIRRTLPQLPAGGVFGIVVPQGLLHGKNATSLRRTLCSDFELKEICLFPDKVFSFSDAESAVLLGRKTKKAGATSASVSFRRVREHDMARFRQDYQVSSATQVDQRRFLKSEEVDLRVPDLADVWQACQELQTLSDLADLGKGLEFESQSPSSETVAFQ